MTNCGPIPAPEQETLAKDKEMPRQAPSSPAPKEKPIPDGDAIAEGGDAVGGPA
jgi:hypothetical protein